MTQVRVTIDYPSGPKVETLPGVPRAGDFINVYPKIYQVKYVTWYPNARNVHITVEEY